MRQRVVSSIALSCQPELLIADEPTTALDVTVQAAYLALLRDIQRTSSLAILFITHDLAVVSKVCDRVAVMYGGRVVEILNVDHFFAGAAHPYSQALIQAMPDPTKASRRLRAIEGQPPSVYNLPPGCPFADRCPMVMPICRTQFPPEKELAPNHFVSCWLHSS